MRVRLTKTWKWVIGVVAGILVLLVIGVLYLGHHWKPMLTEKLKTAVAEGSDGLYRLDFKDIYLNLLTGYISVESPALVPDTAVYRKLLAAGAAPKNLFTIKANKLAVTGASPLKAWLHKEIEVDELILELPKLGRVVNPQADTVKPKDDRTLYQRISKSLKSIRVGRITITDADVESSEQGSTKKPAALKHFSILVKDVLIDSAAQFDKTRFYSARDIFFRLNDYNELTADGMYRIKLEEASASSGSRFVNLKNLRVIPLYPEMAFSRKFRYQKDRYTITIPGITLHDVDFNRFDEENRLIASSLIIEGAKIAVFLNRSLPPPPIDKWVNFPHVILRKLKVNTLIDTLRINNSRIDYKEFNPLSGKSGSLFFSNFNAKVAHVTNDSLSLAKDNHARANLSANLFGKKRLNLYIDFNLTDPKGAFSYSGNTSNLDLTLLNDLNRPLSLVEVKSGFVQRADFNVRGNRYGSTGTLKLRYTDLKIQLLKTDKDDGTIKKKGLLSAVANTVLVKDDNPSKNEPLRISTVTFERPHWSSFFNLLWKGVFVCIKESVGLGIVKEKKTQPAEKLNKDKQKEEEKAQKKKEKEARKKAKEKEKEM